MRLLDVQLLGGFDAVARVRWTLTKTDGALKFLLCTAYDEDLSAMRAAGCGETIR